MNKESTLQILFPLFELELSSDNKYLTINDTLDFYFFKDLTKQQVLTFIEELSVLANKMENI